MFSDLQIKDVVEILIIPIRKTPCYFGPLSTNFLDGLKYYGGLVVFYWALIQIVP